MSLIRFSADSILLTHHLAWIPVSPSWGPTELERVRFSTLSQVFSSRAKEPYPSMSNSRSPSTPNTRPTSYLTTPARLNTSSLFSMRNTRIRMFKRGELSLGDLVYRGPTRHHRSNSFLMAYGIGTYMHCTSIFVVKANHSDY